MVTPMTVAMMPLVADLDRIGRSETDVREQFPAASKEHHSILPLGNRTTLRKSADGRTTNSEQSFCALGRKEGGGGHVL